MDEVWFLCVVKEFWKNICQNFDHTDCTAVYNYFFLLALPRFCKNVLEQKL